MEFGVFDHIEMIIVSLKCVLLFKIRRNMSKSIMMSKKKYYTLLHSCDNIVNHTFSLGFKLLNRDLGSCSLDVIWGGWSHWGDFCHWSVFYWSKCTKLCQNRSWYQNKTRHYSYTTLSRRIDKILTHVLCVHRVPNYHTNYPTWLFPMSVAR